MRIGFAVPAGLGLVCVLTAAASARAQTAPAASPPAAAPATTAATAPPGPAAPAAGESTAVQGVVVKADDAAVKSAIDRRSYSVEADLQATSGSIADALKRVPSVEVDIEGNVKLRGDSSVTILIDGKPSAVMRGQGRADALQQLPADQIERVEVLTNPGAEFSPEGTGGIINLVTKKSRRAGAGVSGSVRANVGTRGRLNGGINWAFNGPRLSLSANAGFWRFASRFDSVGERTIDGPGGVFGQRTTTSAETEGQGGNIRLAADYDLDPRNRISGEANLFLFQSDFDNAKAYEAFDGGGASTGVSRRRDALGGDSGSGEASLSWRREFAGADHVLTLELRRERWVSDNGTETRVEAIDPPGPGSFETFDGRDRNDGIGFKGDYSRPMPDMARLKAGFEIQKNTDDSDGLVQAGPAADSLAVDAARTHRLVFEETVVSGYLTYERPFGDLTILAGLRFESATNEIDLLTTGLRTSHGYDRVYPSLHLDYRLGEAARLKASYSLRIRRPGAYDLDPWLTWIDAYNYRQGNPDLEPSETRSWEASWEYRKGRDYYLATAFWRQTENGVADRLVDLGGGVLLTTKANLAEGRSGGLEFAVNRALGKTLGLNLTGTAAWTELDGAALGVANDRSAWSLGGRASLDWQVTAIDLVQINAVANGKYLLAQGYIEPSYTLNLGYRRKLDDRWFLTVTAADVLDSQESRIVTDAPGVRGVTVRKGSTRGLFVGLRYRFGAGKPQRDPGFDYGSGQGGGPSGS
ncbi:MAG: TonB-dependent receptor domain-containing protein [Pseudomonadota bacterium]